MSLQDASLGSIISSDKISGVSYDSYIRPTISDTISDINVDIVNLRNQNTDLMSKISVLEGHMYALMSEIQELRNQRSNMSVKVIK